MPKPNTTAKRSRRVVGLAVLAVAGLGVAARTVGTNSGVTAAERARALPGDDLVPKAQVVFDRASTLLAPPERVWPWIVQLGKARGGWYLPGWLETVVPRTRRGLRRVDPAFQQLSVGDEVPDWGPGPDPVFRVARIDPPHTLVYSSERPRRSGEPMRLSWTHMLTPAGPGTRLHLRLRIDRVGRRAPGLVAAFAGLMDEVTVRPMFAGLAERAR